MKLEQTMLVIVLISIIIFAILGLVLLQMFAPATVELTDINGAKEAQKTPTDTTSPETEGTTDTTITNNTGHVVVDVETEDTTATEEPCESSLITCGCHAAGTSPESSGLLGGINCYGLYGLTGCEEIDGVCFAIYEQPGLKVDKSVYAMSETINITYKPPKGTWGPYYDCKNAWKVERFTNGVWTELQTNPFDTYNECKESGPKEKTNTCEAETMAYTRVYKSTWDLNYWLKEPQMCNGEVFTGVRKVNSGPGHYRITWNDSTAEFQITS
ncbi:MAG: hypothetical protein JXA43_03670 [Candidatus Diapherotrites archaeon]|nr:hypothetical protein [Candidatus Diapherotrites archaeon]